MVANIKYITLSNTPFEKKNHLVLRKTFHNVRQKNKKNISRVSIHCCAARFLATEPRDCDKIIAIVVEECVSDANTIAVLESEIYTPERSYALFFFLSSWYLMVVCVM